MTPPRTRTAYLAAVIRRHRRRYGLSQKDLAYATNLSVNTVNRIECGRRASSVEILYQVADGLGMRLSELMDEAEQLAARDKAAA